MAQNNAAPQAAPQTTNPRSGFSLQGLPGVTGIQLPGGKQVPVAPKSQQAPQKAQQAPAQKPGPQVRQMQPVAPRMLIQNPKTEIPGDRGDIEGGIDANDIVARMAKMAPSTEGDATQPEAQEVEQQATETQELPSNIDIPESEVQQEEAHKPDAQAEKEFDPNEKIPAGEKAQRRWVELKKMEKQFRTLRKEMEELKKKPANSEEVTKLKAELEQIRKERDETVTELRAIDVTKDPEFKSKVEAPLYGAIQEALGSVPEGARKDLMNALTANTRVEMMSQIHAMQEKHDLQPWQMDTIRGYANDIIPLARRYQEVLANKKTYAERLQQEREQRAQDSSRQRNIILDQQYADAAAEDTLKTYFDDSAKQAVKEFMDSMDEPVNAARAAVWSHVGPRLQLQVQSLQQQIAALKKDAEKQTALTNDVSPKGGGFASSDEPENYNFDARSIAARLRSRA